MTDKEKIEAYDKSLIEKKDEGNNRGGNTQLIQEQMKEMANLIKNLETKLETFNGENIKTVTELTEKLDKNNEDFAGFKKSFEEERPNDVANNENDDEVEFSMNSLN